MDNTVMVDVLPVVSLSQAAACLKVLAHPTRLRVVDILLQGDFTVREIATLCEAREHQICEHLRLMQNCGLLTSERHGRSVHYRVESPQVVQLMSCIRQHCGAQNTVKE